MARTALVPISPIGGYPATPLSALAAAMALTAADVANGNAFPHTGREVIVVQNADASAQTITLSSVADDKSRTGDITAYSIPAAGFAVLGPFPVAAWRQADGNFYISASNANVKFAILRLPALS